MKSKTPVSKAESYLQIGEFWDKHDATEFGEQIESEFNVNITSQRRYYAIDGLLSSKIKQLAKERGVSEETLLNLWVQEKLAQTENKKTT